VQDALATSGLAPGRLKLEITESVLMQNSVETLALLHQLQAEGVRIALDDFGTGYSSLSYLRSFPFDPIKIDRSFVRHIDTNDGSCLIVGAIVALAQGLGMTTLAEGVETQEQLEKVREQGCALVQGYLFSRPHPRSEVSALIQTLRICPSLPYVIDDRHNGLRIHNDKVLPVATVPDDRNNGRFAEALIRDNR
jgi:EAL domain-containing protein (putative c-di-GMP-specific phosphodiesterase class I)